MRIPMEIINGYQCRNCTDVGYAKKHIDPAHPKDGAYGVNSPEKRAEARADQAVKFGGSLSELNGRQTSTSGAPTTTGTFINLRA